MTPDRYGAKVRYLRRDEDLTGREFSRRVKISPSYLVDIEQGRRLPAPEVSDRIADELGTDRDGLWRLAVLERLSDRDRAVLAPLAPEVQPRRDGLREALDRIREYADAVWASEDDEELRRAVRKMEAQASAALAIHRAPGRVRLSGDLRAELVAR